MSALPDTTRIYTAGLELSMPAHTDAGSRSQGCDAEDANSGRSRDKPLSHFFFRTVEDKERMLFFLVIPHSPTLTISAIYLCPILARND